MNQVITLSKLDSRIPAWRADQMQHRHCPICDQTGSTSRQEVAIRPDGLRVHQCLQCKTFFVSPAPINKALTEFYLNYRTQHSRQPQPTDELAKFLVNSSLSEDFRLVEISTHLNLANSINTLDVGCAEGATLARLRNAGANAVGIDLDAETVDFTHSILSLNVIHGDLLEINPDYFAQLDLITMFDFIEHPLQPICYIEQSVKLLRSGGLLAIWTPNGSSISAESGYVHLRVDLEHMQYLTFEGCRLIADLLGLTIIHLESVGYPDLANIELPLIEQKKKRLALASKQPHARRGMKGIYRRFRAAYKTIRYGVPTPSVSLYRHEGRDGNYHLFVIFKKVRL